MTISYPLSPPASPSIKRLQLYEVSAVSVSRSPFTFNTQVQAHQGQMWGAQVTLPQMSRSSAEAWHAFLLSLNGPFGTFTLYDPLARTPQGAASGAPLVNGASQTGQTLITDGWNPSVTGILKAGDYIQLGQSLYKVLKDVDSDGSGNATLDIFPRLRTPPGDNTLILTDTCKGIFRLFDSTVPIFGVDELQAYDVSFHCIEAL